MQYGHPKYRMMCNALAEHGELIYIHRVGKLRYQLHVNFEAIKTYRQRQSCNSYIKKRYQILVSKN
jgi:hypothetical protein